MLEFWIGIAVIIGVAKMGEAFVELARSRNAGTKGDVQALRHEIQSLRQELADYRAQTRQAHPLVASTTRTSSLPAEDIFAPVAVRREPVAYMPPLAPVSKQSTEEVAAQLARLQSEMHTLRDTTTQFDMSFDAAVDRLERRLADIDSQKNVPQMVQVGAQK